VKIGFTMNPTLAHLLAPLGLLYGAAMQARRGLYARGALPRRRLPVPVVSIGNLSLGGTGKTPFASWLAHELHGRGLRPAIVLRGYGRESRGARVVADGQRIRGGVSEVGDEALVLARNLPGVVVVVGESRFDAGVLAVRELGAEVVILDDGFQQLGLHRDLDIVLVEATRPPRADRVLPAGRLRERPESLAAADVVAVTRSHLVGPSNEVTDWIREVAPEASVVAVETRPRRLVDRAGTVHGLESLHKAPVLALSAIGAPAQFEADLERLGARLAATLRFRDHHRFDAIDVKRIEETCRARGAAFVVTTAKDLVRLELPIAVPVLALEIDAHVRDAAVLWQRLARVMPLLAVKV